VLSSFSERYEIERCSWHFNEYIRCEGLRKREEKKKKKRTQEGKEKVRKNFLAIVLSRKRSDLIRSPHRRRSFQLAPRDLRLCIREHLVLPPGRVLEILGIRSSRIESRPADNSVANERYLCRHHATLWPKS